MSKVEAPAIVLLRDCNVRYRGRAEADQFGGVLLVLIKDDLSVVVHDLGQKVSPQFYNPGGTLSVWTRKDRLYIRSVSPGSEELRMNGLPDFVREIEDYHAPAKPGRRYMRGLEDDLVDWLIDEPSVLGIEGLEVRRQEKRTGGRVDLLLEDGTVVEVKRKGLVGSVDQARRYLRDPDVDGVVIACLEASETLQALADGEENISIRRLDRTAFESFMDTRREAKNRR